MENEWVEHDGATIPSQAELDDMVEVRFRDGCTAGDATPMTVMWWKTAAVNNWFWGDSDVFPEDQIVAYRVVTNK